MRKDEEPPFDTLRYSGQRFPCRTVGLLLFNCFART
jgi:hypothetical protein